MTRIIFGCGEVQENVTTPSTTFKGHDGQCEITHCQEESQKLHQDFLQANR